MNRFSFSCILLAATAVLASTPSAAAQNRKTIWNGVYSDAQAARGQTEYENHCSGCHGGDLDGQNTAARLRGDVFMERWREFDLGSFFALVKATMPRRQPGSLNDRIYVDILAHILRVNAFPPGGAELTADGLKAIQIEGKDGPKPLPSGALVQLVGCLTEVDTNLWMLTSASEPARTSKSNGSTEEELSAAERKALGAYRFRFQSLDFIASRFSLDEHRGHKVQTKGYLVRQPNRERIDLTSMESIASTCER